MQIDVDTKNMPRKILPIVPLHNIVKHRNFADPLFRLQVRALRFSDGPVPTYLDVVPHDQLRTFGPYSMASMICWVNSMDMSIYIRIFFLRDIAGKNTRK